MDRDQVDEQKIIVNQFEENITKTIKQLIPLGDDSFLILTNEESPNNLYLAEYFLEVNKPVLLKGEKRGPALVVKDIVNIEAHEDISLGGVNQSDWRVD